MLSKLYSIAAFIRITIPGAAFSTCGSGSLPLQSKAVTNRLTAHELPSPLPSPVTVTVTLKITQAKAFQSVGDGSDGKTAQGRLPSPVSL